MANGPIALVTLPLLRYQSTDGSVTPTWPKV
jgi:hypothetical protein